jgi:hypothetical protein
MINQRSYRMWSRNCLSFRSIRGSLRVFSDVRVAQSFIFYIVFCGSLFVFSCFFLFILCRLILCLLRFTATDYSCGFFKLFRIKRLINGLSLHNYQIRLITVVILVYIKTNMNDVLYDK